MWMWIVSAIAVAAEPGALTVKVDGLRNAKGVVRIALHNQADAYPDDPKKAVALMTLPAAPTVTWTVPDLPPGTYAVSLFHDEDENGAIRTNFIGIPTEGLGVSNNPKLMGPPTFEKAAFAHDGDQTQTVKMKYFL